MASEARWLSPWVRFSEHQDWYTCQASWDIWRKMDLRWQSSEGDHWDSQEIQGEKRDSRSVVGLPVVSALTPRTLQLELTSQNWWYIFLWLPKALHNLLHTHTHTVLFNSKSMIPLCLMIHTNFLCSWFFNRPAGQLGWNNCCKLTF